MKKDFEASDKSYNAYTDTLRNTALEHGKEISKLRDQFDKTQANIRDAEAEIEAAKVTLSHHQKEIDNEKALQYEKHFNDLQNSLNKAERARKDIQNNLSNGINGLTFKIRTFEDQQADRRNERENRIKEVQDLLNKLKANDQAINGIIQEREKLANKLSTDDRLDDVSKGIVKEIEGANLKLKWAEEERDTLRNQMNDALNNAKQKEQYIKSQEDQIKALLAEIEIVKRNIEDAKREIQRLKREIQLANEEIERLKGIIEELDRQIMKLEDQINQKQEELGRLQAELKDKDLYLDALCRQLGDEPPKKETGYRATKGDLVDEMLAKYINIANCPVPIKRLGGGFYLFGLKKIYAKIMNGKLVIRVGGGYMIIEEFISSYAQAELNKLEQLARREGVENFMELDLEYYALGDKNRNSVGGKSPGGQNSPNLNGTQRGKTLTINQIKNAQQR